jgi:uncharacterized repeat protein (TIGR03803 family)
LTLLASFAFTNGLFPYASLTLGNDGNFYGTTESGGSYSDGTIFRVTTNGVLTSLYSFTGGTDGANPYAGLTLGSDGKFYGTTELGGTNHDGTVFKVTTNGVLTSLASFNGTNGAEPYAGLTLGSSSIFYGTTYAGGISNAGTIFKVGTNGILTSLASFVITNGQYPYYGSLALGSDGNLYGTTSAGGSNYEGTVFQVTTNGVLTSLVSFTGFNGSEPYAGLTLGSSNIFYGTTYAGGSHNAGTIFQVTTNGGLTSLVSFANTNGLNPVACLTLGSDGNLYGTTCAGGSDGSAGSGTVFQVTTNGRLTSLASFTSPNGRMPVSGLTLGNDGNFYGTTQTGGSANDGTVFQVTASGGLTSLVSFAGTNGATPLAGLTLGNDGNFYGTTYAGGTGGGLGGGGAGTIFQVTTNGGLTTLYMFTGGADGGGPQIGRLTLGHDGNFYGTAPFSGGGYGTVFQVTTNGGFTLVYSFTDDTNGAYPLGGLTLGHDGNLYGTTEGDQGANDGTAFQVTTNGGFTLLYSFTGGTDGAGIEAGLALGHDGNFYGTAFNGGSFDAGTIFQVTTNGGFTSLYSFTRSFTNGADGKSPLAGLTLGGDGNFYGTTGGGGLNNSAGTIFRVTTNGVLTTLAYFDGTNGAAPHAPLTLGRDGNFYSTTDLGGSGGGGVIYRLALPPEITCPPASQVVPPGNAATFTAAVFGTAPFTYQWLSNSIPIAGATNSTLTLSNAASYQVIIANAEGSVTSSVASLTLELPPVMDRITNNLDGSFTLYFKGAAFSTNQLLTTTNLQLPLSQWQVVVTNVADINGSSQYTDTNTSTLPAKFYILSAP